MSYGVVLIVEDDKELNDLIARSLLKEGYKVIQAYDGLSAETYINNSKIDLTILDLMIPSINGLELLRRIRLQGRIPVIIISAKVEDSDIVLGLGLGADDYMTKPFRMTELKARVQAQLRRYLYFQDVRTSGGRTLSHGHLELNPDSFECLLNGVRVDLTAKEFEILKLLMTYPKKVFTKAQLFEQVWGGNYMTDENTVMVHIRRLRKKIEKDPSNPVIIQTAWGIGYRLGEQP
ncbi:response regulator transcription factor [Paenibacillus sp. GCM10027626]|uniref:response regulator transcription factor n=1 Tax=Paenibacillus sp. GCM10027626 TaxID=3273411 RepID=UPI00363FC990